MTRLLRRCASVGEALAEIAALPHAGGGTMVLADAAGSHAAVELGHRATGSRGSSRGPGAPAPTTSCLRIDARRLPRPPLRPDGGEHDAGGWRASRRRWPASPRPPVPEDAASLMAGHAGDVAEALCRHGEDGDSSPSPPPCLPPRS